MIKKTKSIILLIFLLAIGYAVLQVAYPDKIDEVSNRVEINAGIVVDNTLSYFEKRIGLANVAIIHYENVLKKKRQALINIKASKRGIDDKIQATLIKINSLAHRAGRESEIATLQIEKEFLISQSTQIEQSSIKVEQGYKDFLATFERKKVELKMAEMKLGVLTNELNANKHGNASESLKRAASMENELKDMCNRLEAEIDVQSIENNY